MSSGSGLTDDGILVQVGAEHIRKDCERSRSSRRTRARGINFNYGSDELTHVCSTVTLRLQNGWRARKKRSVDTGDRRRRRARSEFSFYLSPDAPEALPPSAVLRRRPGQARPGGRQPQWEEFGEWQNQKEILDTELRDTLCMNSVLACTTIGNSYQDV